MIFIDLMDAFDSVSRTGLWLILREIGCTEKFVNIVHSFHDGMPGQVLASRPIHFAPPMAPNRAVYLPHCYSASFFSMTLSVAFKDCNMGIPIQFHTDAHVLNLRRLQACTKTHSA